MKVGDLVKVDDNACEGGHVCGCWFCSNDSSRVGVIVTRLGKTRDPLGTIAPEAASFHGGYWSVLFDAGEWRLYGKEMEVISEIR